MLKKGYKDIKEEVIVKRTKKSFDDWRKILDKFNVKKNGRKEVIKFLVKKYRVNPWWAQVLLIRYAYEEKINFRR